MSASRYRSGAWFRDALARGSRSAFVARSRSSMGKGPAAASPIAAASSSSRRATRAAAATQLCRPRAGAKGFRPLAPAALSRRRS